MCIMSSIKKSKNPNYENTPPIGTWMVVLLIDDSLQMQILGMIRRKMKSLCADVFTKLLWDKAFSRQADNTSNGVYMEANIVINFVYERNNMSELQA